MFPDTPRCSQMHPDAPRCSRIFLDAPESSEILPQSQNCASWSQIAPKSHQHQPHPKKNTILGERETQMSGPSLVYFNRVEKRRWKKHLSTTSYLGKFSRPVGDDCCGSPLLVRNASETRPKRARTHPKRVRTRPKRARRRRKRARNGQDDPSSHRLFVCMLARLFCSCFFCSRLSALELLLLQQEQEQEKKQEQEKEQEQQQHQQEQEQEQEEQEAACCRLLAACCWLVAAGECSWLLIAGS